MATVTLEASVLPVEVTKVEVAETSLESLEAPPLTCYETSDPSVYLGKRGVEKTMVNRQNLRLKTYYWPAASPKATLLFVHGHGNHLLFELLELEAPGTTPRYGGWVKRFNEAGISVFGLDNQGCGRSEGLRGLRFYADSFDHYIDDVQQLVKELPTQAPAGFSAQLPLFITGISLGGCIVANVLLRDPARYAGAIFLAPMLSLERVSRKGLNPYLRPLASLLSRIIPAAPIVSTAHGGDDALRAAWDSDPYTSKMKTRLRLAVEFLRITEATSARLEDIDVPFLAFHSENDDQCDPDGTKALFLRASTPDKSLRLVNHMWHVLVKETGNEAIQRDIIAWVLARI